MIILCILRNHFYNNKSHGVIWDLFMMKLTRMLVAVCACQFSCKYECVYVSKKFLPLVYCNSMKIQFLYCWCRCTFYKYWKSCEGKKKTQMLHFCHHFIKINKYCQLGQIQITPWGLLYLSMWPIYEEVLKGLLYSNKKVFIK